MLNLYSPFDFYLSFYHNIEHQSDMKNVDHAIREYI